MLTIVFSFVYTVIHSLSHLFLDLGHLKGAVLLHKARAAIHVLGYRLIRPPLHHVAVLVVVPTTVIEAVRQLVAQYGANRPVV